MPRSAHFLKSMAANGRGPHSFGLRRHVTVLHARWVVYKTSTQKQLDSLLTWRARTLLEGGYESQADLSSCTILGIKGCGKTVALSGSTFAEVLAVTHAREPITVYINCKRIPLSAKRPLEYIFDSLVAAGLKSRGLRPSAANRVLADARQRDKRYIPLLVD
eukprot:Opistho-2@82704